MSLLASLIRPDTVLLDLEASGKGALFDALAQRLAPVLNVPAKHIAQSLNAREKLGSTALGHGIAIPHGRIKYLDHAICAFVRPREPLPFGAPDDAPVGLLFVLLVPEHSTDLHLQVLSELAQHLSERAVRERLMAALNADDVMALFA